MTDKETADNTKGGADMTIDGAKFNADLQEAYGYWAAAQERPAPIHVWVKILLSQPVYRIIAEHRIQDDSVD